MILVNRGPAPYGYEPRAAKAARVLRKYFDQPASKRVQTKTPFQNLVTASVKDQLLEVFHGKCAYCETPLRTSSELTVEAFRPRGTYWWLAYEWTNLLAACTACNRAKAQRFPIMGKPKAEPGPGDELQETRLLLDPCSDTPSEHLVFASDGRVFSHTAQGQATIDTLGLNRAALVASRHEAIRGIPGLMLLDIASKKEYLLEKVVDSAPYAGAARQALARTLEQLYADHPEKIITDPLWDLVALDAGINQSVVKGARHSFQAHEQKVEGFELEKVRKGASKRGYFAKARAVERVQIRNFKTIRSLDIRLASTPDSGMSWLMMLGENATGKTSVLRAIALALMGNHARRNLGITPIDVLTRGATSGHVRVWLTGVSRPIELKFRSGSLAFRGQSSEKVILLGFGATRLFSQIGEPMNRGQGAIRVNNLFDPTAKLVNAERWLVALSKFPDDFNQVALLLKEVLRLRPQDRIEIRKKAKQGKRVVIKMYGDDIGLDELSDGYRSILALSADVLSVLVPIWRENVGNAEGIVLIDELDAHLHPTWRMMIVRALRACFPYLQFIASTHDPLCLQGLKADEVVVLQRSPKGRVTAVEDLPSPEGMSVEQILTSEIFGLGSAVDPDVQRLFEKYYALLAKRRLTREEARELQVTKAELDRLNHMGRTRREQLLLEVIDGYLAEGPAPTRAAQEAKRDRMLARLVDTWLGRRQAAIA